jgi:hypothetical protein
MHPIPQNDPRLIQAVGSIAKLVSDSKLDDAQEVEGLLAQFRHLDELLKRCSSPALTALCGLGTTMTRQLTPGTEVGPKAVRALLAELVNSLHTSLVVEETERQSAEDIVRAAMEALEGDKLKLTVQSGRLLGEVLIAMSMLDADAVEQALALQRRTGMMFGKALIKLGKLSAEGLQTALRVQQQRRTREGHDPTADKQYGTTKPLPH